MGAHGSGTLPVGLFLPTSRVPSAAYADGRYEQAGIGESPPSSDARHFFIQAGQPCTQYSRSSVARDVVAARLALHPVIFGFAPAPHDVVVLPR
jgi:hypothetical protein